MEEISTLNEFLFLEKEANAIFQRLCKSVDQEIVGKDEKCLLMPGSISPNKWTMTFDFSEKFKDTMKGFVKPIEQPQEIDDFEEMDRSELEEYIDDNDLDVNPDYISDTDALREAVKSEVEEEQCASGIYVSRFESIGFSIIPGNAQTSTLCIYVEMDCDDSNWPYIKRISKELDGEILLHDDKFDFHQVVCKRLEIKEGFDPKTIAENIEKISENIISLA